MKIGIFSDIHGNIYAFRQVWKKLEKEHCDKYYFLGDICGYYYYQNEVVSILRNIGNLICIKGNHDDIFLQFLKNDSSRYDYMARYGKSHVLLKENVLPETLKFLDSLPESYADLQYNIGLFHGSPSDHLNGYAYPTDSLEDLKDSAFSIILLGHTHYPMCKQISNTLVVNPGSCGQPRDYNQPSYTILDTDTKKVVFRRVFYDVDLMVKDVLKNNEKNDYLIEVLQREHNTCAI